MFGAQNTPSSGGGGFSFVASTPSSGGGFSFGSTTQGGAQGSAGTGGTGGSGFPFGATPATTAGGMSGSGVPFGFTPQGGLGGASAGGTAGGFGFGATKAPASTTGTPGFGGFGTQQPAQTSAGGGGGGFAFGTTATPSSGSGIGLGSSSGSGAAPVGFSLGVTPGGATSFGVKQLGTATTSAPASTGGFSGFGTTPATTSAAAGGSLLGGLLSSTASTTAPAAASSTSGFGFGASSTSTAATPAAAAASTGFSFGSTSQTTTSAPTLSSGLSLGFGTPSASASATSTSITTSTTSVAGLPGTAGQKQMTFRQLEETINKWTTELEDQEKYFLDQATQVNAWDRIVMENGEKIIQLNKDVEKVKLDQQKLDHELDFVHSQQRELEDLLAPLEKALDSMPPISYQQHADAEREHTYMLAESLDSQLKRMGQDLKEIIERLNSTNTKPDQNDPVQQITKILNAHVVSLMWVDRNTANLQRRVEEISRQMDIEKREQERNFRLAYS